MLDIPAKAFPPQMTAAPALQLWCTVGPYSDTVPARISGTAPKRGVAAIDPPGKTWSRAGAVF